MDVARHLRSSEEAIITAASSDEKVRVLIFQLISQEGLEVRISACGGHGFPVFSPPGHTLLPEFAGPGLVAPLFHKPKVQMQSRKVVGCWQWRELGG